MINAYNKMYLSQVRNQFGMMLDYVEYDLDMDIKKYWDKFIKSDLCKRFEKGDISVISGKSGVEIVFEIIDKYIKLSKPNVVIDRSREYWAGWAITYYQWSRNISFEKIDSFISIDEIINLYHPYHEMDILSFCDKLDELYLDKYKYPNLKILRERLGISQGDLAFYTNIPVRTIQEYEQRKKDINKANMEYILSLSKILWCNPQDLYEPVLVH